MNTIFTDDVGLHGPYNEEHQEIFFPLDDAQILRFYVPFIMTYLQELQFQHPHNVVSYVF